MGKTETIAPTERYGGPRPGKCRMFEEDYQSRKAEQCPTNRAPRRDMHKHRRPSSLGDLRRERPVVEIRPNTEELNAVQSPSSLSSGSSCHSSESVSSFSYSSISSSYENSFLPGSPQPAQSEIPPPDDVNPDDVSLSQRSPFSRVSPNSTVSKFSRTCARQSNVYGGTVSSGIPLSSISESMVCNTSAMPPNPRGGRSLHSRSPRTCVLVPGANQSAARSVCGRGPMRTYSVSHLIDPRRPRRDRKALVYDKLDCLDIKSQIGDGAFGTVYHAVTKTSKPHSVAVKTAHSEAESAKIAHEMQVMRVLKHDFVIRLGFAFTGVDGKSCIAMQYCDGGDLFDLMSENSLTIEEANFYFIEIALGLDYLHSKGVIHGDLKPENIGLSKQGHIKILDFGEAILMNTGKNLNPVTNELEVQSTAGTLQYCSPEKLAGKSHGTEVDWWSLGVIYYELMFFSFPWGLDDIVEEKGQTIRRILYMPLTPPERELMARPGANSGLSVLRGMLNKSAPRRLRKLDMIRGHHHFRKTDWEPPFLPPFKLAP